MNRFFHGKWIWTIVYPLIFFISWTYVGFDNLVCYALDHKPARTAGQHAADSLSGFDTALGNLESILAELQANAGGNSGNASALWERFDGQMQKIEALDQKIKDRFERDAKHMSRANLDEKIMKRQHAHVAQYQQKMGRLYDLVADIRESKDDPKTLMTALAGLEKLLKERGKKRKTGQTFDPDNMPFQNRKLKPKAPRMDKESFERELKKPRAESKVDQNRHAVLDQVLDLLTPSADAAPPPPVPEDLAETMEIKFTEDILAKAAELNHDPVKIYNWVRNYVEYVPTWGSIQGAQYCLETLQGNAFDTASLLIALLRASNIPARYVMGTVEIPIDQVMNWVGGFTDAQAAADFIASGGTPITTLYDTPGGQIKYARMEHVWVEAFVDYSPSRASRHKDGQGDTWIEMDPSFKQYEYTQGVDLQAAVPFDVQNFVDQVTASAEINEQEGYVSGMDSALVQTKLQEYKTSLEDYLNANMSGAKDEELFGSEKTILEDETFLQGTLPYKKAVIGTEFNIVPDNLRHRISFQLYMDEFDDTPLQTVRRLPEVAGKKITISYRPATQADQTLINSYLPVPHVDGTPIQPEELPQSLPANAINVVPELRIDGEVVASGLSVGLGTEEIFTMQFADPSIGSAPIINIVQAGEYFSIGLNLGKISQKQVDDLKLKLDQTKSELDSQQFTEITKEEILGDMFFASAMLYHVAVLTSKSFISKNVGTVSATLPSEAIFGMQLVVDYLWGIPRSVSAGGLYMDADHLSGFVQATDGDSEKGKLFMIRSGIMSSAFEHSVPEQLFSTNDVQVEGISAVKALRIAAERGDRIYTINQNNSANIIPALKIDSEAKANIYSAIASGNTVIVSYENIDFNGWVGCGYIILDPDTGSGSYMISGGTNGSWLWLALLALASILLIAGIILTGGAALGIGATLLSIGGHLEIISFIMLTKDYNSEDWAKFAACFCAIFFGGMGVFSRLGVAWGLFFESSSLISGAGCFPNIWTKIFS